MTTLALVPCLALLASWSPAIAQQAPLSLIAKGASYPGTLDLTASPGTLGSPCVIMMSVSPGPTPLAALGGDPRSLTLGLDAFSNPVFLGAFGLAGAFQPPTITVPFNTNLQDVALYFQAFTFPGQTYFVDRLSNPAPVWFGMANTFRDRGKDMATERAFAFGETLPDGRFMVFGGGTGTLTGPTAFLASTEIYDAVSDAWSVGPTMATEHFIHRTAKLQDDRVLVVAGFGASGFTHDVCELYDPATHAFTTTAPIPGKRFAHTATTLPDGRVLVTGGIEDLDTVNAILTVNKARRDTQIYDPATGQWTAGPVMREARGGHWAQLLPDGKVLLAGGIGYRTVLFVRVPWIFTDCEVYDPATNTLSSAGSMLTPRSIFDMADLGGGRYLAAGGISSFSLSQPGIPTNQAEVYDSNTDRWTTTGSLYNGKALGTMFTLCDGRVILIGGGIGSVTQPAAQITSDIYDPALGTWTQGPLMSVSRVAYAAWQSPTGAIYVCGGGTGSGSSSTLTAEWFHP